MQCMGTVPMAWKDENKSLVCTKQSQGLSLLQMSAALRAQVMVLLNSVFLVHLETAQQQAAGLAHLPEGRTASPKCWAGV